MAIRPTKTVQFILARVLRAEKVPGTCQELFNCSVHAARREYAKIDKLLTEVEFGPNYGFVKS